MPSSEDFPALSTHEALERTKFELAELIKILAKRLGLDGKHEAAMATAISGRDRGARSILKHGDPYMGLLKDVVAELIHQRDNLAGNVCPNDKQGAPTTTTIKRRNLEAGNTSAHEDPYIARLEVEQDELRRERGFGAGGTLGPADNGHSATTTINNRRGLEAGGSTAEPPEIIVTAPCDDVNEPVSATINARHHGPGSHGPGASSTFTPLLDDNGRALLINAFTGLYNLPHTGSQQHIPEARILPEDDMLTVITNPPTTTTTTNERRDIETANLLIAYTTKLLGDMYAQAELDHENERKFLKRSNAVSVSFVVSTIVIGIYIGGGL